MNPFIINRPDLQTLRQRFGYSFLTLLFWLVWFYLWIPLLSLVGWIFGIDLIHDEMIVREGIQALIELLGWYFLVIFLMLRFRGKERRGPRPVVGDVSLAGDFSVTSEQVALWRECKRLVISHDVDGNITNVVATSHSDHF